jgi:hypothetical protein
MFYNYDLTVGGSIFLKIHPGTYLLGLCALWIGVAGKSYDRRIRKAALVIASTAVLMAVWCVSWGHTLSLGFLLDALFTAGLGLFCVSYLDENDQRGIFKIILFGVFVNGAVAMLEFATHTRLLPYPYREPRFRPAALFSHPLTSGLIMATAVPLVMGLRNSMIMRGLMASFLIVAIMATGARMATIGSFGGFILAYAVAAKESGGAGGDARRQMMAILQLIIVVLAIPTIVALSLLNGLGYRFAGTFFDESAKTRVDAFTLLRYMDAKTSWIGTGAEALIKNTHFLLGGRMESPFVIAAYQFGIPVALLFALFAGITFAILVRRSPLLMLSAFVFFSVGLSNDALVGKTTLWMYALLLAATANSALGQQLRTAPAAQPRTAARTSTGLATDTPA